MYLQLQVQFKKASLIDFNCFILLPGSHHWMHRVVMYADDKVPALTKRPSRSLSVNFHSPLCWLLHFKSFPHTWASRGFLQLFVANLKFHKLHIQSYKDLFFQEPWEKHLSTLIHLFLCLSYCFVGLVCKGSLQMPEYHFPPASPYSNALIHTTTNDCNALWRSNKFTFVSSLLTLLCFRGDTSVRFVSILSSLFPHAFLHESFPFLAAIKWKWEIFW